MSEWTWVKNPSVNQIPGRVPKDTLPAWEARGWEECPEPSDDVEVDAPASAGEAPVITEPGCTHPECTLDHPHAGPAVLKTATPSTSGPKKENDRG